MQSSLVMTGVEWRHLCDLISMVLSYDDAFRKEIKKTLLWDRSWVEAGQQELKRAGEIGGLWSVYVMREGSDHPIIIRTREPQNYHLYLASNERMIMCVPKEVRVKTTEEVLLGIANACCKAIGLHDAMKEIGNEGPLTDFGYKLARDFWKRCHLHWRRSVGASKAAWKKKGYIAEYKDVADFREAQFHEGSQFLYDLNEESSKNEKG